MERTPSDEELREWWQSQGSPPVTAEAHAAFIDTIVVFLQATTASQWIAGKRAPYDLYDHDGRLVEAVSGDATPIIRIGDRVPANLAERVAAAAYPTKPEPKTVDYSNAFVLADITMVTAEDEDGNPVEERRANIDIPEDAAAWPDLIEVRDGEFDPVDYEGPYVAKETGFIMVRQKDSRVVEGDIDPTTFVGVHLDAGNVVRVYDPTPDPQLLTWIDRGV